jgi:hypothetical protein
MTTRRMSTQLLTILGSSHQSAGRYILRPPHSQRISTRNPTRIRRSSFPSSDHRSHRRSTSRCYSCSRLHLHPSIRQPTRPGSGEARTASAVARLPKSRRWQRRTRKPRRKTTAALAVRLSGPVWCASACLGRTPGAEPGMAEVVSAGPLVQAPAAVNSGVSATARSPRGRMEETVVAGTIAASAMTGAEMAAAVASLSALTMLLGLAVAVWTKETIEICT